MLYFTEDEVRRLLPMPEAIALMRTAFTRLASGEALNQPRRRLVLPTQSVLHYMAAGDGKYFGAKIYSTNPRHGAHFFFLLYRAEDGIPLALFEANFLGQIRTGAASGLATDLMARADAQTVGMIGSGYQAQSQLEAMRAVRRIRAVKVWSRSRERRESFARQNNVAAVETAEEAIRNADIVVTATNSKDPVLEAEWIAPGTHINAMGSNHPKRRELPADLIHRADWIVVDSIEQARMESGDLLLALDEKAWTDPRVVEFREVVAGKIKPTGVTVFKSNGLAVEDVIAAGYVYEQGEKAGLGRRFYS